MNIHGAADQIEAIIDHLDLEEATAWTESALSA